MLLQNLLPKRLKKLIIGFSACLFITGFVACNNDKKDDDKKGSADATATTFKMNCVILTKAQIQQWVDSGWTNPASTNRIKTLLFQFYSSNAPYINSNMQLITYPGSSMTDVHINGKATMSIDTNCVAKTISGPVVFANNSFAFDDLKITNPNGTLNDFDFIRLIPTQGYPPYINFNIEIVRQGVAQTILAKGTDPCPPYCPAPPPPMPGDK